MKSPEFSKPVTVWFNREDKVWVVRRWETIYNAFNYTYYLDWKVAIKYATEGL